MKRHFTYEVVAKCATGTHRLRVRASDTDRADQAALDHLDRDKKCPAGPHTVESAALR